MRKYFLVETNAYKWFKNFVTFDFFYFVIKIYEFRMFLYQDFITLRNFLND